MTSELPWFEAAFGDAYSRLYSHRSEDLAIREVRFLLEAIGPLSIQVSLDLGCGAGRHLRAIENHGISCIGLDLSKALLGEARAANRESNLVRGDMRQLPFKDRSFDAVFQLFTAYGYFSDEQEDQSVLAEVARVLKPGGRHILDYLDADSVRRNLVPESHRDVQEGEVHERRWIAEGCVHKEVIMTSPEGQELHRHQECVRLYGREDLERQLAACGLSVISAYGAYDGRPSGRGDRCILIAERPTP